MNNSLIFFIFLSVAYLVNANPSIDAQLGTKYQFELFENFKSCDDVYKQESKAVDKLIEIKSRLIKLRENLSIFSNISKISNSSTELRNNMNNVLNFTRNDIECFKMRVTLYIMSFVYNWDRNWLAILQVSTYSSGNTDAT